MLQDSPPITEEIRDLAISIAEEIQDIFLTAESSVLRHKSCFTRTRKEDVMLYIRAFSCKYGQARYFPSMGAAAIERRGRVLVFSNIEFVDDLRGRGLMQSIVQEAISRVEELDIIEFENVINRKFAQHLESAGFLQRDPSVPIGGSLYKTLR